MATTREATGDSSARGLELGSSTTAVPPPSLRRRALRNRTATSRGLSDDWGSPCSASVDVSSRRHELVDPIEGRVIQRERGALQRRLKLLHGPRSNDHGSDGGMGHREGNSKLGKRAADARREIDHASTTSSFTAASGFSGSNRDAVEGRPTPGQVHRLVLAILARQESPRERAPGQHPHPVALADRKDRRLDPASKDRVRRLLGREAPEAAALGDVLRLDDLLRRKGRAAERSDLPLDARGRSAPTASPRCRWRDQRGGPGRGRSSRC